MSALTRTAATMDEEFSAPVDLLPPAWMKHCTIAPAQQMPGKNMDEENGHIYIYIWDVFFLSYELLL
jgi:hypothetical protein